MVGEGTGYDSLTYTVSLNAEEGEQYGVGFRQGSDLAQALNDFFAASYADGSHGRVCRDLRHSGSADCAVIVKIPPHFTIHSVILQFPGTAHVPGNHRALAHDLAKGGPPER